MKISANSIPMAAGVAIGAILLHQFLYSFGIIIADDFVSRIYVLLYFGALITLPFSHVFRIEKYSTFQLYLDSFTLSILILSVILLAYPLTVPIIAGMLLIYVLLMVRTYRGKNAELVRSAVYATSIILLLWVAGIIRFGVYDPSFPSTFAGSTLSLKHVLLYSIYNNENPLGVPFYFAGGVVIQGITSVLTVSVQSIIIYALISAFLTENYYLIISYVLEAKKGVVKGAATAVSTALSCQCETISAALPGLSVLFLSIVSVLLLSEGFAVLLFTYLVISRLFKRGKDAGFMKVLTFRDRHLFIAMSFILIAAIPIIEIIGILYNLISNLLFLMGTGILMFSEGATIMYLVREIIGKFSIPKTIYIPIILASTITMFIWYAPSLLFMAGTIPFAFLLMNASSLISGALAGALYLSMNARNRLLLAEYTLMMFSMAAIVVFYFSVIRNFIIWPYFGLGQQTVFSILLVAVSLPLTVLNTNLTLNSYATPTI